MQRVAQGLTRGARSSFSVPAAWWHLKGKRFIYWTLACLIPVGCLSTSILTGKLGTQIPHTELSVDLYCDVSGKLSTAEKETVLYSKDLGDVNSKSSVVLFIHVCGHRKKMKRVQLVLAGTHPIICLSPQYSVSGKHQ